MGPQGPCSLALVFTLYPGVSGEVKQGSDIIGFLFGEDGPGFLGRWAGVWGGVERVVTWLVSNGGLD